MRRVWWKKNEIKFLLENYQSMYTGEISRVLDRSISGIETKMRDLKISPKSDAVYKRFTKKQLNFITKNSTIMPSADIAIALHRDAKGVRNKMVSMGLSPLSKIFYWDSKKDDILKQNRLLPYEELMGMVGCQRRTLQARMKKLKLQKFRNKSLQSSVEITCPHCLTPYPKTSDFFYFKDNGELWSSLCKNCARLRIVNYNSRLPSYIAMLLRGISCDIKRRHKRGMEMNIDREYILSLYEKQGGLCAITGIKMQFKQGGGRNPFNMSIDRIDSMDGYTRGNIQLSCVWANLAKQQLSMEDLFSMIKTTYNYLSDKGYESKDNIRTA